MTLTSSKIRDFYDAFGKKQDKQFYEDAAIDHLIEHGEFEKAGYVVEFGCGTGKLASRLLTEILPDDCRYLCLDISQTMISLCRDNTKAFYGRATCVKTEGEPELQLPDQIADRFVSTYVLDLMSEKDAESLIDAAYRLLQPGGKLCLASLTHGVDLVSRTVELLWNAAYRVSPKMTGGCRPVELAKYIRSGKWAVAHNATMVEYGVPSEVLIAKRL